MTGATGFVGGATMRDAVAAGWHVRALTRRPQPERDGVTWIMGALDQPDEAGGAAVRIDQIEADPRLAEAVLRDCASLTPEIDMKWDALQPAPGEWRTAAADGLVAFEFSIGWPELAVELMLPASAFEAFCANNRVQRLDT